MSIADLTQALVGALNQLDMSERVQALNEIRKTLHEAGPFANEPVDCVLWVPFEMIRANTYNPNTVAAPEMELLALSILADGYTQPIVTYSTEPEDEVVDGFHRHRVGKENTSVRARVHGYLPVARIRSDRAQVSDRMAATIRHNRARGEHRVEAMSDIVVELIRRGWKDEKIAKELGMDADEVLRLKQATGLADMFADKDFSEAWEPILK